MKPEQEPKEKEADIVKEEAPAPIKYGISGLSDVILVVEGQEFHVHKMVIFICKLIDICRLSLVALPISMLCSMATSKRF